MTPLMIAIIGTLRSIQTTGARSVGSIAASSSVAAPTTVAYALPSGCAAGDTLVASVLCSDFIAPITPAGWTQQLLQQSLSSQAETYSAYIFTYRLTSGDIATGSVGFDFAAKSGNVGQCTVVLDVYRGLTAQTPATEDVATAAPASLAASPATVALPLTVTNTSGDMLHAVVFETLYGTPFGVTARSDWTLGAQASSVQRAGVLTCHQRQASAGDFIPGGITFSYGGTSTGASSYAVLMPLLPVLPMTLTGTLPNASIGSDYHGELTLGGDFTAPVTIDASSGTIPSWMTVTVDGTTVNFDATAAEVPSAAEMDSFTVRATDSSATPQVATSAQTVSVANTVNVKVTIDHTKVTEDLTDFPVYVDLSDMPAAFWDKVKNRGSDIRCYAGATELPREVVHCDRTAKVGELWIKADLSATADTVLTIKADGQSDEPAFTAANGRDAVWSNGFAAVWHMQQGMASDNWLLNPGAETGDTTSWILESGAALRITGSDSSLTAVGGYMFLGGHGDAVLYQDVDVTAQFDTSAIDAGTTGVRFAALLGSAYAGDFGQLLLQCLDGTGAVLSTDSTALQDPYEVAGNAVWMPVSITKMLPAGTRTVRCKLGWHLGAGSYANTAFDSCTLSAAAAPVAAQTDSTGNGNSLTPIGTFAAGAAAAGQVGNALSFSGSNNAQALDAPSLDMGTGDLTLSMWLSPASLSTIKQALIDKGDGSTSGYRLFVSDSSATKLTLVRGSAYADGVDSSAMLAAGWQLVHAAATGAAAAFYRNGVAAGTGTLANTSWTNANAVQVGYRGYSGSSVGYYTGQLDEVRIAAAHRSQGWAAAEYANQSTPTTFYTVT